MLRFILGTTILLCFQLSTVAQTIPDSVLIANAKARVVDLTAHMRVKNKGKADVSRYVFRVTIPPELASQSCRLLACDVKPSSRKTHKSGANEYFEFHFPVSGGEEVVKDVTFRMLLKPVDFLQVKSVESLPEMSAESLAKFTQPSKYIESDSTEVLAAAKKVFKGKAKSEMETAKSAYEAPSKYIKFKLQKKSLGAKQVLKTNIGDCTEYACLFAALCRTQSIPARRVGVFNFAKNKKISLAQPNHHIAEVHLPTHGWIPVDPNLGRGKYNRSIGFGKLDNTFVVLNREGAWVWSTWLPPKGYDKSKPKPKMEYDISWDGKIVQEGDASELQAKFEEDAMAE